MILHDRSTPAPRRPHRLCVHRRDVGGVVSQVLYEASEPHRHRGPLRNAPTLGTVAQCDCGQLLRWGGDQWGDVGWHPLTQREERKFKKKGHL